MGQIMDENKSKALAAALSQIEKQFGKGSIMRLGEADVAVQCEAAEGTPTMHDHHRVRAGARPAMFDTFAVRRLDGESPGVQGGQQPFDREAREVEAAHVRAPRESGAIRR